jgi:erythromycin esterase
MAMLQHQHTQSRGGPLWLLITALAVTLMVAGTSATPAAAVSQPVAAWVQQSATPLTTVDPAASLDDLQPLRPSIGDAAIVGLGESVHGAAEEIKLKHRTLRFLVEEMGFRSVAW